MNSPEITVIDYGVGNLLSVQRGLEHCGARVILTDDPEKVLFAERVVLPGVGAFGDAMQALGKLGLISAIRDLAVKGTPLLGICLGMQLLLDESEEFGMTEGLGLIAGRVIPIPKQSVSGEQLKIPHIGWNALVHSELRDNWKQSLLIDNVPGQAAYFVHSYMSVPNDPRFRVADCYYGGNRISAVIAKDNITGCQFHPEKSGEVGLKILRNFCVS